MLAKEHCHGTTHCVSPQTLLFYLGQHIAYHPKSMLWDDTNCVRMGRQLVYSVKLGRKLNLTLCFKCKSRDTNKLFWPYWHCG